MSLNVRYFKKNIIIYQLTLFMVIEEMDYLIFDLLIIKYFN